MGCRCTVRTPRFFYRSNPALALRARIIRKVAGVEWGRCTKKPAEWEPEHSIHPAAAIFFLTPVCVSMPGQVARHAGRSAVGFGKLTTLPTTEAAVDTKLARIS